jgi:hypothetical protein
VITAILSRDHRPCRTDAGHVALLSHSAMLEGAGNAGPMLADVTVHPSQIALHVVGGGPRTPT